MSKRLMDIVVASVLVVIMAPIWAISVLIILIGDFGPIFFRQERVGRDGKIFQILKFRTMKRGGDRSFVTTRDDPRVYPGGEVLRRYKLDELPQLFNVLLGDMSLVGPRPTVKEDYDRMTSVQRERSLVRPGITGLAQISGNTSLPWAKRIELDLEYIRNQSLVYDLKILWRTAKLVITGKAETHPQGDDEWK